VTPTGFVPRLERLPRGLLVDLDDTIVTDGVNADRNWHLAVASVVEPAAVPLPADQILAEIERERRSFWADADRHRVGRLDLLAARRTIVAAALGRLATAGTGPVHEPLIEAIVAAYTVRADADRALLPGAVEALRAMRELGLRLALVTNGAAEAQRAKIERFELAPLFDVEVIEGVFGAGKPEPQVYHHALALLDVAPSEAAMVGDNLEWDVATPQRVGMRGVWVDPGGRGLPVDATCRPDAIVSGLLELAALFRDLN
jgi:putative hydrolase of the HAD superfamily